jgi:HIV Tat-specific factor 1
MDGRWFNENQLEAYIAGGTEKFKKTDNKKADVEKDEQEDEAEDERLDKFGSWLEEEEERT